MIDSDLLGAEEKRAARGGGSVAAYIVRHERKEQLREVKTVLLV